MSTDGTIFGIVIAVIGLIGSVLVARISTPSDRAERLASERTLPLEAGDRTSTPELRVSPEIWRRFAILEEKVDHLTALVETQKEKVSSLERLLRMAMRVIRRANRRLTASQQTPEEIPRELIPYSIE